MDALVAWSHVTLPLVEASPVRVSAVPPPSLTSIVGGTICVSDNVALPPGLSQHEAIMM